MKKHFVSAVIGLVSGVLNGLFGAGGGTVVVPALEKFLKLEERKAHATAIGIIFIMSLSSSLVYIFKGAFDFNIWLPAAVGGVVGGFIGAKFLRKISIRWLKLIFGGILLFTAFRMFV